MKDVCQDTLLCYNQSRLSVTVSDDEIWQGNAAVGKHPVPGGDCKTDFLVFAEILHFHKKVVKYDDTSHEFGNEDICLRFDSKSFRPVSKL